MTYLSLVLVAKIAITGLFVGAPFLMLPAKRIVGITGYGVEAAPLFRLYGTAIFALLVGYTSGFWAIAAGEFPWGVVAMGLFSNGVGATVMLATGAWRRNRTITFFIAGIAVALAAAALMPELAIKPVF